MKVLVIATSLRENSNSDMLAKAFMRGAEDAGHETVYISLKGKNIGYCDGCLSCQKTGVCTIKDDMTEILEHIRTADVIAFSTPIYYYEMCGQMKTLLDRANPLYGTECNFRRVYMLSTAAEYVDSVPDRAIAGLCGWIECFPKAKFAGSVFKGGVNEPGEINGSRKIISAYEAGKSAK